MKRHKWFYGNERELMYWNFVAIDGVIKNQLGNSQLIKKLPTLCETISTVDTRYRSLVCSKMAPVHIPVALTIHNFFSAHSNVILPCKRNYIVPLGLCAKILRVYLNCCKPCSLEFEIWCISICKKCPSFKIFVVRFKNIKKNMRNCSCIWFIKHYAVKTYGRVYERFLDLGTSWWVVRFTSWLRSPR
jgi:hypothetical protein